MPYKSPEASAARSRAYYQSRREEIIAKVQARVDVAAKAAYDRAHNQRSDVRAVRAAQRRAWRLANPEKTKAHDRERSLARRRATPDEEALAYMAVLDGDPCAYCGGAATQIDHVVPLKLGGDSMWSNLTAACSRCNYAKSATPLLAFLAVHFSPSGH